MSVEFKGDDEQAVMFVGDRVFGCSGGIKPSLVSCWLELELGDSGSVSDI